MNKFYTFITIALLIFFMYLYTIGKFHSDKICFDDICVQKPNNYAFLALSSAKQKQDGFCIFSLSCEEQFSLVDDSLTSIVYVDEINEKTLSIMISTFNSSSFFSKYLNSIDNYDDQDNCLILKEATFNHDFSILYVDGYIKNKDITFNIVANDQSVLKNAINDICKAD